MCTLGTASIDQRGEVSNQLGDAIILDSGRTRAAGVAPLVGCQASVPLDAEPLNDAVLYRIQLREAVQEDDHWPVGRTFVDDIEHQLTAAVLIHLHSI